MCENKQKPSVSEDFRQTSSTSNVEKFHQLRNRRKKFCFRFELLARAAVCGGEGWKDFSVHCWSNGASRTDNLTGLYLFIKRLVSWSKTIYVRISCWSSQVNKKVPVVTSQFCLLQGQVNRLGSSFELVGDKRLLILVPNQYVNVECNQLSFIIKTGNDSFLSWFRCRFRKSKDWLTKTSVYRPVQNGRTEEVKSLTSMQS